VTVDGFLSEHRQPFAGFRPGAAECMYRLVHVLSRTLRIEVDGVHRIPAGAALLVANHAFGWDVLFAMEGVWRERKRPVWTLGEHTWWKVPFLRRLAAGMGTVDGTPENADRLLQRGELVLVLPGGLREAVKPRELRYRLLWGHRYGFIRAAIRKGTLLLKLTPVFVGSAYKNKGVQALLDAVLYFLPDPTEVENVALDLSKDEAKVVLEADPDRPLVALAFKLEEGRFGQLTYLRVYQGKMKKGDTIVNARTGRDVRVGRLVRMHADEMEDINESSTGDIVALFGVDCASGDTFTSDKINYAMTSMHVPAPVIHITIKPKDKKAQANVGKALQRFTKEDPTFHARVDEESGETVISGMGELHLDVYVERMKREYNAEVETGAPQVAYREAITRKAEFNYLHKKQTGGSGQYGRVGGYVEPYPEGDFEFVNDIFGGSIPQEFIPSVEKGFRSMLKKGRLIGFPLTNFRVVINDGAAHAVDSSDNAFQAAARGAFRDVYDRAKPAILEPIMKVAVEGPTEFQGAFVRTIMQRRGIIVGTTEQEGFVRVDADVPLAEMFGYSTDLRSSSQGKAEYTMEFARYAPVPGEVSQELVKKYGTAKKDDEE
jgi:elongation factor G